MKNTKEEQDRLAEIIQERFEYVQRGRAERRRIEKRLEEAPVPTPRAAKMVGRVNKDLVTRAVEDTVYDTLALDVGGQVVGDLERKLPRIIAQVFKQYAVENEFGDTFSEKDYDELEDTMPEIMDMQQELAGDIAIAITGFAKEVAKMAMMLVGVDNPVVDEPAEEEML